MAVPGIDHPGAGVGLAILRDRKILLYRRVKAPEAEHWNIVGGKIDHGEAAIDAARREAEEETGLAFGRIDFLCHAELVSKADGHHWISLLYVTSDFSGEPRLTEPDKLTAFGWYDLDALPAPLSHFATIAAAHLRQRDAREDQRFSASTRSAAS